MAKSSLPPAPSPSSSTRVEVPVNPSGQPAVKAGATAGGVALGSPSPQGTVEAKLGDQVAVGEGVNAKMFRVTQRV